MWPWGHLAVGYLSYRLWRLVDVGRGPGERETVAVAIGTQFPDLVDKPLAWSLGVLPHGRSLAHSLLTAVAVAALVGYALRRRNYDAEATAFTVGYASHLAADAIAPALGGEFRELGYLLWPVVPALEYGTTPSFASQFGSLTLSPFLAAELALTVLAAALWFRDGAPGVGVLAAIPRWVGRKLST